MFLRRRQLELASSGKPGSSTAPGYSYFSLARGSRGHAGSLSQLLLAISGEVCVPVGLWADPVEGMQVGWARGQVYYT